MALLPIFNTTDKDLTLLQNKWSSILNPVVSNPSLQSIILPNTALVSGTNTVNHNLGKTLTGWRIVRLRGPATIYDQQDTNMLKNLTLILVSSAAVNCDIEVF